MRRRSWYNTSTRSILWNNLSFVCLDDAHDGVSHNKHFKTWNKNELVGQNRSQLSIRFLVKISGL